MSRYFIELNDAGLRVARDRDVLVTSPGYATLAGSAVVLGSAAHAQAWLRPRRTHDRFWHALGTEPVTQLGRGVRHAADLAYLHLAHVLEQSGRPGAAVFLVPGSVQRAQLSLLLGIAPAAGVAVSALVDSAVAAGASLAPGRYLHVQAVLHQCVVTEIENDGAEVLRGEVEVVAGCGIVQCERRLVAALVEAFLARCRFDPLHHSATEQALHTRLPEWLAALAERPEIPLALDHNGKRHETRIERATLAAALAPLLAPLARRLGHAHVVLDYRLAALTGAQAALPGAVALAPDAVFRGCLASTDLAAPVAGDGVSLRTRLALAETRAPAPPLARNATARAPSHLLIQQDAFPLAELALYVAARGTVGRAPGADSAFSIRRDTRGARLDVLNGATVLLNGAAITGSALLAAGDHITMPGTALLCVPINVEAGDAL